MKRTLTILLGLVIVVGGCLYAYGTTVPVEHTVAMKITLPMTQKDLWDAISDVQSWPEWSPHLQSVARLKIGDVPAWMFNSDRGGMLETVDAFEPPSRMVLRIASEDSPLQGTWTFLVEPAEQGTSLTIREDGRIPNALLRGLLVFHDQHATIEETLRAFVDHLGQIAEPRIVE